MGTEKLWVDLMRDLGLMITSDLLRFSLRKFV